MNDVIYNIFRVSPQTGYEAEDFNSMLMYLGEVQDNLDKLPFSPGKENAQNILTTIASAVVESLEKWPTRQ